MGHRSGRPPGASSECTMPGDPVDGDGFVVGNVVVIDRDEPAL
jgi:hypothetical protein